MADGQRDGGGIQWFVRREERLSIRGPLPRDVRPPDPMVHERGRLELHVRALLLDEQKLRSVPRERIQRLRIKRIDQPHFQNADAQPSRDGVVDADKPQSVDDVLESLAGRHDAQTKKAAPLRTRRDRSRSVA
jgi:hypothetical protein